MRNGEYDVEVFRIEDFRAALIDPELFQDGLTAGAMPVAAGGIVNPDMTAFLTYAGVEAEPSGLAVSDGKSGTALLTRDRMLQKEVIQGMTEDLTDRIGLTHRTPAGIRWDWHIGGASHWTDSHRR